jgi:hypothetical protein
MQNQTILHEQGNGRTPLPYSAAMLFSPTGAIARLDVQKDCQKRLAKEAGMA